jgi:hypothetical protein
LATIALVVVSSGNNSALAASSLVNGNFETGDLTGWSVDTTASGGDASANGYGAWFCSPAECWYPIFLSAQEGSYFAQLTPGKTSEDTVISLPFEASAGDRISGWVFIHSDDYYGISYGDSTGQVVIKNESGETVATPFSRGAFGPYYAYQSGLIGWTNWHYDFTGLTGTGKFTIEARVRNLVDNPAPSAMGLDNVKISTASVDLSPPNITSPQNDAYDTDGSFSVSGTAGAGSTVELFEGANSKGTTKADSSSGAWSIALSGVPEGNHTYSAKATDAAGNTSSASDSVTVTVDNTAPKVDSVAPTEDATGVAPGANVTATFSEGMQAASVKSAFKLYKKGTTTALTTSVSYDATTKKATLDPSTNLRLGTTYKAVVSTGAKDLAGHPLDQNPSLAGAQQKVWFFTIRR